MAMISALAGASARVWWVVAYWTPRASTFRRRTRALELGVEWQRVRECPADDEWRQQVERDIATSAVVVPIAADLLADAVERGVPVSRRWRRRHQRAITRMRVPETSELRPVPNAVVRDRRRTLARMAPVVAALALGSVVGPAFQHELLGGHPAAAKPGAAASDFRYHCSQCEPGAKAGGFLTAQGKEAPVFTDPIRPPWVLTDQQLRNAARRPSAPR